MIVPKKPLLIRRSRYIRLLVDTFKSQIPSYLQTGFMSLAVLALLMDMSIRLCMAYPNRDMLQKVIDEYSAEILLMDEVYKKTLPHEELMYFANSYIG